MFWNIFVKLCNQRETTPTRVVRELGIPSGSVTSWKNGMTPRSTTVQKLADYFGVTSDYLLGKTDEESPTEEALKVALFGGTGEVTPEMWEEVKQFAEFVKKKHEERNS